MIAGERTARVVLGDSTGAARLVPEMRKNVEHPRRRHGRLPCTFATAAAIVCGWTGMASAQAPPGDADAGSEPAAPPGDGDPSDGRDPPAPLAPRQPERSAKRDDFVWRYPQFRKSEYAITGIFGAMALGGLFIPSKDRGSWSNGLDEGVRDALRADSREGRKLADDVSDITLITSMNYVAFDAAVVAWWGRNKGSVAYQMAAIDIEALAINAGINSIVKGIAGRSRPLVAECDDPFIGRTAECDEDNTQRSFFSGHASTAFTTAGLTCMHHAHLALYDDPIADAAACVAAFGLAGTTGALRIVSDNHHTTDVLTGAAIGTAVGLGVPWLLHYKDELPEGHPDRGKQDASITIIPGPTSAAVVGTF